MASPADAKLSQAKLIAALRSIAIRAVRGAASLVRRGYAASLIAVIVWATWLAFTYLADSLLVRREAPQQITGLPMRLDESLLRTRRAEFPGLSATQNPRTPPAHYHQLSGWFQPDRFNDCTRGGCHGPLPHTKRKEVRAFLNMHATSIHCGVCHINPAGQPPGTNGGALPLTWYDLQTGRPRETPALLRAQAWLDGSRQRADLGQLNDADQRTIVEFLRKAAREADSEPQLAQLAEHVAAVRADSDAFPKLLQSAGEIIPRYFRGEYNAKLALAAAGRGGMQPLLGHPGTHDAVRAYLSNTATVEPAQREALLRAVHPLKRDLPLSCGECHRADGGRVDFAALGYAPPRTEALRGGPIFLMIEHIDSGRAMQMPEFITPGRDPRRENEQPR